MQLGTIDDAKIMHVLSCEEMKKLIDDLSGFSDPAHALFQSEISYSSGELDHDRHVAYRIASITSQPPHVAREYDVLCPLPPLK